MMSETAGAARPYDEYWLVRILAFLFFGTAGMGGIALAVLAPPVAGYYADKDILHSQEERQEKLKQLLADRNELIQHANDPGVIERAAIGNLGYQPVQTAGADLPPLPEVWPELEEALGQLEEAPDNVEPQPLRNIAESLSEKPTSRIALFGLGSALLLVSLACFNRPR